MTRFSSFGQPVGTDSVVLWQGASESLSQHGAPGEFSPPVSDLSLLRDTQYLRFQVLFRSSAESNETQSIRSLTLPYELRID